MKGWESFIDVIAMAIGMIGALLKGMKKRLKLQTIFVTMTVAGIMSFSLIGVVELFWQEYTPKMIILIAFFVGWLANEITEKIDLVFDDIYEYLLHWIKNKRK